MSKLENHAIGKADSENADPLILLPHVPQPKLTASHPTAFMLGAQPSRRLALVFAH
jgi:hypothetical protein